MGISNGNNLLIGNWKSFFLLVGERCGGCAILNRFGVDAWSISRMKRRDNDTIVFAIKKREAETLVATDIFEWIEADETDAMEALLTKLMEFIGDFEKLLDFHVECI